jgi:hypothetical protein
VKIVITAVGAELQPRRELPSCLELAAVGDALYDALVCYGSAGYFGEGKLEADQRNLS